jgi:hypothetical protein
MSEQNPATTANDATVTGSSPDTNAKPQKPRKRAQKDTFSVSDLARARLRKRGIKSDERLSDECKVVRGILRANFALVSKNDATVRKAKDAANDRKPWPRDMGKHTFDVAVNGKRAKS